ALGVAQAEMEGAEPTHGEPDDVRLRDGEVVEHGDGIRHGPRLRVGGRVMWDVRRRIAPRIIGDAAVAPAEGPHLWLPAPAVAAELVGQEEWEAPPRLFIIKLYTVIGGCAWHRLSLPCVSGTAAPGPEGAGPQRGRLPPPAWCTRSLERQIAGARACPPTVRCARPRTRSGVTGSS